jgi:hypothetical protein
MSEKQGISIQKTEYIQLSINYYSSGDRMSTLSNEEDSEVWKGLQNYLDILNKQGWIMINETKTERGRFRTYHLKKLVE